MKHKQIITFCFIIILGIALGITISAYAGDMPEIIVQKKREMDTVEAEKVEQKTIYYGVDPWELNWPDAVQSLNYISDNRYVSTYNIVDALLYTVHVKVDADKVSFSFPDYGIKTENYKARLQFSQTYTNHGYFYRAASTDKEVLMDFVGLDSMTSRFSNIFDQKKLKENHVKVMDSIIDQECFFKNSLFVFTENKTYVDGYRLDIYKQLAEALTDEKLFNDVAGYQSFTQIEKDYLQGLAERIKNRATIVDISIDVLPNFVLSNEDKSETKSYRVYGIDIIEELDTGLQVKFRIDGLDFYHINRDWCLNILSKSGFSALHTQKVADILGLGFDELTKLIDTKDKIDKGEDGSGLIYYTTYESDSLPEVVGVLRVRWNKLRGLENEED